MTEPTTEPPYGWDNAAPGTRLWRLRAHPETLTLEDAIRVALELDIARAEAFVAGRAAALGPDSELRRLSKAATPGPWESDGTWLTGASKVEDSARTVVAVNDAEDDDWEADRTFIVAAVNYVRSALAHPAEAEEKPDAV